MPTRRRARSFSERIALAILLATLALGAACSDDDDSSDPTATSPAGTGVALVDQVIAAVNAKDATKLASLLEFWPHPCVATPAVGEVTCPAGAAPGTPVMVVGLGAGELGYLQPGSPGIAPAIDDLVGRATKLYAVLEEPTFPNQSNVPGKYQIIFEPGVAFAVGDRGITFLSFDGLAPEALIASGRYGFDVQYLVKP
ncbi:MAG: hypothetical protein IH609_18860 [Dehalococcoidia bacterium]|nr:hypothetical protein [Dehalococcoidia bacterium]